MGPRERVVQAFRASHGREPTRVVRAPGRVNLIGEHTDYNDGFVLPMAIDRAVWLAIAPAGTERVSVHSLDFDETRSFALDEVRTLAPQADEGWMAYLKGTAWALTDAGHDLAGFDGVLAGDVPIGAGLSSSAAVEMATARAFAEVATFEWSAPAMALLGQRAENRWVGMNCGIMDQMISASGRSGHALLIDCRSLETRQVPLPEGTRVVVLDTGTRRGLVDSAYNERRAHCEQVAVACGVAALRDVEESDLDARAGELDAASLRRARHVVTENARTLAAAEAMEAGDARRLGTLMDASHESLRDDFEVSSEALDTMVEHARRAPGALGARMTGAGFGGCAVALVERDAVERFVEQVARDYGAATGNASQIYVCSATDGAGVVAP